MKIRQATAADVPVLASAWQAMLAEARLLREPVTPDWREALEEHFVKGMKRGRQHWVVAEGEAGSIVGTGAAFIRVSPAVSLTAPSATIAGVYTLPTYRRLGVARAIVERLIEACRERGCEQIRLRASSAGRPLYEALGFKASDEMVLDL